MSGSRKQPTFYSLLTQLLRIIDQWGCCLYSVKVLTVTMTLWKECLGTVSTEISLCKHCVEYQLTSSGKQNFFSIVLMELTFSAKTSKSRRTCDIISMLVNVYGSKELFVNEYRTLLADRLLSQFTYNTEKEIRYLELLKIRYATNVKFHFILFNV